MGSLGRTGAKTAEDLPAYGLLQRADELGINVNLYCPEDQVGNIHVVVRAFPGVTFSLDHLGVCSATAATIDRFQRPRFESEPIPPASYDQVLTLARYQNVYIKISGEYAFSRKPYPFADMRPMVERAYQTFGADRLMWCSDFPWIVDEPGYTQLAALIDRHLPHASMAEREQIMGGNAMRVWFES
jgi:predicted TIM-barrel fold metal-dependent hydrolase